MTRKSVSLTLLGVFVISFVSGPIPGTNIAASMEPQNVFASESTCQLLGNRTAYPIMQLDGETVQEFSDLYSSASRAYMDPAFASERGSFSLLDHLEYTPTERDQGDCDNCWVWAGTGVLEVALDVQEGIKDRLSVQYFTSSWFGGTANYWACCPGNMLWFADWYQDKGFVIPWSNTNAYWQDGDRTCEDGTSVPANTISTTPNYPLSRCTAKTVETHDVGQAQAIDNIKNVLHQSKAVVFSFSLPNTDDWDVYRHFWKYESESAVWNPDYSCGHSWVDNEGGGHGVLCVGYDDTDPFNPYWIMVNSWGTTNGRLNGIFHVDMNMNYDCTVEIDHGTYLYNLWWQTLDVGFTHNEELHYDDGTPEEDTAILAGAMCAVRFTPRVDGLLTECSFYITEVRQATEVKIHVMDANKRDIITPISFPFPLLSPPLEIGWNDVYLHLWDVAVSSGVDFYIAIEETVNLSLGCDTSDPDGRSWFGVEELWLHIGNGDYLIRAVVETVRSTELRYDDGTFEKEWYWKGSGGMYAVVFTPPMAGRLTECSFYITRDPARVKVHVKEYGTGITAQVSVTPTSTGWCHVDLSASKIVVSPDFSFYIAIEWTVANKPYLGDDMSDPDGRSWKWNGVEWLEYEDGNYMIRAVVETEAPDLIVSDISWSPTSPVEGDTVTFTVYIRNQGAGDADFFKIGFSIWVPFRDIFLGSPVYVMSLSAGKTTSETFTWTAVEGNYKVKAYAEPSSFLGGPSWSEIWEANNRREEFFQVSAKPKPDLIVSNISWTPEKPLEDETVTFTVTIGNRGSVDAGRFKAAYYVDDVKKGEWTIYSLEVEATTAKTFTWTAVEGSHTVKVFADSDDDVMEEDETNNEREATVGNQPPMASFCCYNGYNYLNNSVVFMCESTCFNASQSYDPEGSIVSFSWNFGDGNTTVVTSPIVHHNYTDVGNYTVTLNVTDNQDLWSTVTANVEVTLLGDLDGNMLVNIQDIAIVSKAYTFKLGDPDWNAIADLDNNGEINIQDIAIVSKEYGKTAQ